MDIWRPFSLQLLVTLVYFEKPQAFIFSETTIRIIYLRNRGLGLFSFSKHWIKASGNFSHGIWKLSTQSAAVVERLGEEEGESEVRDEEAGEVNTVSLWNSVLCAVKQFIYQNVLTCFLAATSSLAWIGLSTESRSASWMKGKSSVVSTLNNSSVSSKIFRLESGEVSQNLSNNTAEDVLLCIIHFWFMLKPFGIHPSYGWQWIEINQVIDVQTRHLFIVFSNSVTMVLGKEFCYVLWHQKMNSILFYQSKQQFSKLYRVYVTIPVTRNCTCYWMLSPCISAMTFVLVSVELNGVTASWMAWIEEPPLTCKTVTQWSCC